MISFWDQYPRHMMISALRTSPGTERREAGPMTSFWDQYPRHMVISALRTSLGTDKYSFVTCLATLIASARMH
jgi:hypothetical protein